MLRRGEYPRGQRVLRGPRCSKPFWTGVLLGASGLERTPPQDLFNLCLCLLFNLTASIITEKEAEAESGPWRLVRRRQSAAQKVPGLSF